MYKHETSVSRRARGAAALLSLLLFCSSFVTAQSPLSSSATASLLTCGPGNDFYTTFGHSALRICDTARGIDYVYNYGTFDFSTPHFYRKFMRGQLDYCLSRTTMGRFLTEYAEEGRSVVEQRLNLDPQQTANLFLLLEQNHMPDYRYYRYDFFRDNCATRIRDIVALSVGHADTVFASGIPMCSYRRLVGDNLKGSLEWWHLGIDMLFGLPADHLCTEVERMFLPFEMQSLYAKTLWRGEGGEPFVTGDGSRLLDETRSALPRSFSPLVVFALLFAAVALLSWKELMPRWGDALLFCLAGLLGLFLLFMWFGTDHYCTQWNINILWASPLLILIAIRHRRSPRWALWLQLGCFAVAAVWVVWCGVAPAILLIVLTLALRVAMLLKER